ncbi:putative Alpha-N-acetylgalactosaminidase [Operophtera brumata]|uniref:Putative Alpha-N-acetylgalactosaminidase n=1 Tax=Operophtera brumata TaxID=104452 RepID=A0A0L7LUF8_OPEBR|nr:putative Alpha-N-acetylgalactosaminidase [Operophtera brumata]
MGYSRIILMFMAFVSEVFVLENGLARTPPMGWMSWGYYMCNVNCDQTPEKCLKLQVKDAYIEFGEYLNSRRPVVYSCSWPYYIQYIHNKTPDFNVISQHCNMWRNYHDVKSSWESVKDIMRHFESEYGTLHKYHGPGHWNDPDMVRYYQLKFSRTMLRPRPYTSQLLP